MNLSIRTCSNVLLIALFLTGFVSLVTFFALPQRNPIQVYSAGPASVPLTRTSVPTHIAISDLIDLPVEEMSFGRDGWQVATNAASIASTSAHPGEHGNIVIYSHNLKRLFGNLSRVRVGDTITLSSEDGSSKVYSVRTRQIVNPDEIDALRPTYTETLTLYTCSGLFDSKRLVVQATP